MREHLHVDPGLIHLLDAQFAEVVETFRGLVGAPSLEAGEMLRHLAVPVVLLQRDDRTIRLLHHDRFVPDWF